MNSRWQVSVNPLLKPFSDRPRPLMPRPLLQTSIYTPWKARTRTEKTQKEVRIAKMKDISSSVVSKLRWKMSIFRLDIRIKSWSKEFWKNLCWYHRRIWFVSVSDRPFARVLQIRMAGKSPLSCRKAALVSRNKNCNQGENCNILERACKYSVICTPVAAFPAERRQIHSARWHIFSIGNGHCPCEFDLIPHFYLPNSLGILFSGYLEQNQTYYLLEYFKHLYQKCQIH